MTNLFQQAITAIDQKNSEDPNKELQGKTQHPKELLYSKRMSEQLLRFEPEASEELQIAARAQHICRWKIARKEYPMDKVGYLKWRQELKKMHASITADILNDLGYNEEFIHRVSFLIKKRAIKKDPESQTIEDVICLVFLSYYFDDFAAKHPEDKLVDIIQKTWKKMSDKGHEYALKINYTSESLALIQKALS